MKTRFRRILCPIDFDRISIPALELAVSMARQNDGRVYLLYIIPKVEAVRLSADIEEVATDSLRGVARKWLQGKVPYQIIVRTGAPVSALLKGYDRRLRCISNHEVILRPPVDLDVVRVLRSI